MKKILIVLIIISTPSTSILSNSPKQMGASIESMIKRALNSEKINQVVDHFNNKADSINDTNKEGKTALEIAAEENNLDLVKALLRLKQKPAFKNVLLEAVESDNAQMVKLLLNHSVPLTEINEDERNALMLAKDPEIAQMLVDADIDLTAQDESGKTAFGIAIIASKDAQEGVTGREARRKIAEIIVKKAQVKNIPLYKIIGKVPEIINEALKSSDKNLSFIIDFLDLYDNVFVNGEDENSNPILITAIKSNRADIVHELLKRGAQANIITEEKWTPLMYAAQIGNIAIITELSRALTKDDINKKNQDGETAAIIAMKKYIETEKENYKKIADFLTFAQRWWQPIQAKEQKKKVEKSKKE